MHDSRQDWLSFFMDLAILWATRSTCTRRKVGAIAVKDKRVLASGYNGAAAGHPHCTPETCIRTMNNIPSGEKLDFCAAIHAEQNVILQAAKIGVSLEGCDIYCTTMPCHTCLKLLLNLGIKNIYFSSDYDPGIIRTTLQNEIHKYNGKEPCYVVKVRKSNSNTLYSRWEIDKEYDISKE